MKSLGSLPLRSLSWLLLLFFRLPTPLSACRCIEPPTAALALEKTSHVFRGLVLRQLKTVNGAVRYVVQVGRVYKGCAFDLSDRIVVSTSTNSCGATLIVGQTYVLSGSSTRITAATIALLGKTKITQDVSINLCSYFQEWEQGVLPEDKTLLRKYANQCTTCKIGKDCLDGFTCDKGQCINFSAPCPKDQPPALCPANPCNWAKPCTESKCIPYYCGGCFPIFVAPNGTRVCN
jgi:Tissue inhibitor of metalloproteinase